MKAAKFLFLLQLIFIVISCGHKESKLLLKLKRDFSKEHAIILPLDKGFTEYITGYTSGIVPSNTAIEIRFTPEFAAKADKSATGLFVFDPAIKGKTEWKNETTLVFTPSRLLDQGRIYTGSLNLARLATVQERLQVFPLSFQTLKKDFRVEAGTLECETARDNRYILHGEIRVSDYVPDREAENWLEVKLDRKKLMISWDHSGNLVHKFTVAGIERGSETRKLTLSWNGESSGVSQKGSAVMDIPPVGEFRIIDIITVPGENQKIDIIFSDPLEKSQEVEGLVQLSPAPSSTININSNILSIFPSGRLQGSVTLNVEASLKNNKGVLLNSTCHTQLDFTEIPPGIKTEGRGVILPSSRNLIFPFKAANLKAVDLRIVKIFDNSLPFFLQENDLDGSNSVKRFGRPVYSGRIDLVKSPGMNAATWNLYTINLADYIDVEPGVLYKVSLGMRKSYSLYACSGEEPESKYEELLSQSDETGEYWNDPENFYSDTDNSLYYSFNFKWKDRNNPCKEAYYYPERGGSRNILASNIGIIAKKGEDNILHIMTNDLITAMPYNGVSIEVYDFQLQQITSGTTDQNGSAALFCERKPFLVVAKKDKDRNYLKVNDGSSLSLSSFDVSGTTPENGIKSFIYGERDVWRPGDSIFLSIFIKDMVSDLPPDHPVQFELINPLEQKVDNQVRKTGKSNLLVFATKTTSDAVTGNYRAVFRIGGATFTKRIRIETVKPNRLKIKLSFPTEILGGSQAVSNGSINVKWLNGSTAKNLKSSVEYLLKHITTEFTKYRQFNFDDPANEFHSETVKIFDGIINENGDANFSFAPGKEINAPGMLNAVFTVKAAEPGGDESITQATFKYAPYPVFVGINLPGLKGKERMLFTDNDNKVDIVTVDASGKPVNSEVEINMYKISYRWWWESDQENLGSYISGSEYKPVLTKTITTSKGEGSFTFNIGRNDWGRYLIRASAPSGHSTGKILLVDWPWDYGMKRSADGATLLSVSTNKEKYAPGDEIRLSFPSPENSRAIVTLENSASVLDEIRVGTTKGNTVVSFRAKPEMAPNIYAYVTVIQPHSQSVNDMPVRLYGIVPVMIEDPATRISPVISMPDELRSAKPFSIRVSEASRKPMSYTVAVVDEGLLDLTGFRTPDPWDYFYGREALGVKTWDLYDFILGAFGGTLEKILAVGGDQTLPDRSATKARRFEPVVRFLGPFNLEPGKTNTHLITLPQYSGSVRAMVVAGSNRSFGVAEKTVPVRDPLMILATAPRVISPGEKVALPLTVFIQKKDINEITIKAESNDLISFKENSINLNSTGQGEQDTELLFTTSEKRGTAKISITATGGGETARYDLAIEVRSPNPPETRAETKVLRKGEKWASSFIPFGIEGSSSAVLEASSLPSINLEKMVGYLINYPYGCSEQITSSAFPQLFLKDIKENDPSVNANISANLKEAINRIISRQMTNGGIALWPGSAQPDNWVTSYAGHFMTEAERAGYNISSGFRQKWLSYQKKTSQEWSSDPRFRQSATDQAYRLFTLALAGDPDKGAMNRLRETKDIPRLSKWLLAAAYAKTGRPEVASDLLDVRNTSTEPEYQEYYYGSDIRDKAIILYTLTLLKNEEKALPILKELCDDFNENSWYSTQSIAWGLFSYMNWVKGIQSDNNKPQVIQVAFNGTMRDQTIYNNKVWSMELNVTDSNNQLMVQNSSDNPLYVTLIRKGIPLQSDISRDEKGLNMKVDYLDMRLKPVDRKDLAQGTDFMMVAKISNNTFTQIDNIALTQMVPSGWEIRNTRLFETVTGMKESSYDYRDFRDDRVNTYFSLGKGESRTFVLLLNAAYKGEFYQPSIWCEAMYKAGCYSRFPGSTVKITGRAVE